MNQLITVLYVLQMLLFGFGNSRKKATIIVVIETTAIVGRWSTSQMTSTYNQIGL
jgi:hypothetical protein